jgi:hypothetical protein
MSWRRSFRRALRDFNGHFSPNRASLDAANTTQMIMMGKDSLINEVSDFLASCPKTSGTG